MRESELTPNTNKTDQKKETSFKDLSLLEKEKWADKVVQESNKESSLETTEREVESLNVEQKKAWVELKKALVDGNIQKIGIILDSHKIRDDVEARKLFNEFSIQEAGVDAAIKAINRGETSFEKLAYHDFEKYLFIPYVENDTDFQEAVLKKIDEYLNKDDAYRAYSLIIQFLPKDAAIKENYAQPFRQSLIHILEREKFSINDFKVCLYCFGKFTATPEEAILEPDLQQAAKKTISRLSKIASDDKSVLSNILDLK